MKPADAPGMAGELVLVSDSLSEPDETARERVEVVFRDPSERRALLVGRAKLDEQDVTYRKLVAEYGGNRRARRRARAEIRRKARARK